MDSDFDYIMSIENDEEIAIEKDPVKAAEKPMQVTWSCLSPPYAEKDIMGKGYGEVWQGKRTETLYVSQVIRRFLVDEDGAVESILMHCLKPKTGSGITLEDTSKHLLPDELQFELSNIIAGPFEGSFQMAQSVLMFHVTVWRTAKPFPNLHQDEEGRNVHLRVKNFIFSS